MQGVLSLTQRPGSVMSAGGTCLMLNKDLTF